MGEIKTSARRGGQTRQPVRQNENVLLKQGEQREQIAGGGYGMPNAKRKANHEFFTGN
jgi:hypothetical protein